MVPILKKNSVIRLLTCAERTKQERYPLPILEDILNIIRGSSASLAY